MNPHPTRSHPQAALFEALPSTLHHASQPHSSRRLAFCLAAGALALALWLAFMVPGHMAAAGATAIAPAQPDAAIWWAADMTNDRVSGQVSPGATVLITATDSFGHLKGTANTGADGSGWFNDTNLSLPGQNQADLTPGDVVSIEDSTTGLKTSATLTQIIAQVDATADTVTGQVLDAALYPAQVKVEISRKDTNQSVDVVTGGSGNFSAHFASFNVRLGEDVTIWYLRPDGNRVGIHRSELLLQAYPRGSNVHGQTTPRTRVYLTLNGAVQALKAQATIWSDPEGKYDVPFRDVLDREVLVQPGDTVAAQANGKTATIVVPTPFTAVYNYLAHTVCGQAPAFTPLLVDLFGAGAQDAVSGSNGAYCANFSGGNDPGIYGRGMVRYFNTERQMAQLDFGTPTPELQVQKWSQGQAPAGGEFVWYLTVANQSWGTAAAPVTILTDTLPSETTFVRESTGSASHVGDQVIWHLGSLAPGAQRQITLTVQVKNGVGPGANLQNCAVVTAGAWEQNTGDNNACNGSRVAANEVDLTVNKGASSGNPAPGEEFAYRINFNNNRPAMAAQVRITDTLPPEVTFVSTWQPLGWTVDSSLPGQVVWRADHLAGWSGQWLELRVRLNPNVGLNSTVSNHVEIGSAGPEAESGNNSNDNHLNPRAPYGDLSVNQRYGGGNPIPGGEYRLILNVDNRGNTLATNVVLTDTLPAGATFLWSRRWDFNPATGDQDLRVALAPTAQGTGWVRWDLGSLPNWRSSLVEIAFRIPEGAPGASLQNLASVTGRPAETNPADNASTYTFTTQGPGPNLHVDLSLNPNDLRPGANLQYQVSLRNDGTEPVYGLVLTDTLPNHVSFRNQNWWHQPAQNGQELVWQIPDRIDPGFQNGFQIDAQIDGDAPAGAPLTNTLTVSTGTPEVRYDDNQATVVNTVQNPYHIRVNQSHGWIDGQVLPGAHLHATLRAPDGTVKTTADNNAGGNGDFFTGFDQKIEAGDRVEVDTDGTPTIVLDVVRIDGAVSLAGKVMAGQVYSATYPAQVYGEVFSKQGGGRFPLEPTDGSGAFNYSYAAYPVQAGSQLALWYVRPDGHEIGIVRSALQLDLTTSGINGSTSPNVAVAITLRDPQGQVKGTANTNSGPDGYWFSRVYANSQPIPIAGLDRLHVSAGGNNVDLTMPDLQPLGDNPHNFLQLYSSLPNTGLEVQWDSAPNQDKSDLANQAQVTTGSDGSAVMDFMSFGGLPLGLNGRVNYQTPEEHTISWWWRAMVSEVYPLSVVNDQVNEIHVLGVAFQDQPMRVRLNALSSPLTTITIADAGFIAPTVISFTLPSGAAAGYYDLLIDNPDGRTGYLSHAITIANPLPTVTALLPSSGHWDETIGFTLQGGHFVTGATVRLAQGPQFFRTAASVVVTSPGQITGTFNLIGLAKGRYDVVVSNPGPGAPTAGLTQALEVKARWKTMLPSLRKGG